MFLAGYLAIRTAICLRTCTKAESDGTSEYVRLADGSLGSPAQRQLFNDPYQRP